MARNGISLALFWVFFGGVTFAQTPLADVGAMPTLQQLLQHSTNREDILDGMTPVQRETGTDALVGQFVFSVKMPREVVETKLVGELKEWKTCLIFNEETSTHDWVKYQVVSPIRERTTRIEFEKQRYSIPLRVPVDVILSASAGENVNDSESAVPSRSTDESILGKDTIDSRDEGPSLVPTPEPDPTVNTPEREQEMKFPASPLREQTSLKLVGPITETEKDLADSAIRLDRHIIAKNGNSVLELSQSANKVGKIEQLVFRPAKVLTTSAEDVMAWSRDQGLKTIVLNDSHNLGTQGLQGIYQANEVGLQVSPGTPNTLATIVIERDAHVGWGLQGELELTAADGWSLIVPEYQVVFVGRIKGEPR